jgi:hypothetical protein
MSKTKKYRLRGVICREGSLYWLWCCCQMKITCCWKRLVLPPQAGEWMSIIPNRFKWKDSRGRGLVRMSPSWLVEATGSNIIKPARSLFRTVWQSNSMCLLRSWNESCFAMWMAEVLSQKRLQGTLGRMRFKCIVHNHQQYCNNFSCVSIFHVHPQTFDCRSVQSELEECHGYNVRQRGPWSSVYAVTVESQVWNGIWSLTLDG